MIKSTDNRKVDTKSIFKTSKELIRILGAEPHGVMGDFMVELRNKDQEKKLENVLSFLDIPIAVGLHKSLDTGVIKHRNFQVCTEEEFVEEFEDVTNAQRIHVRK